MATKLNDYIEEVRSGYDDEHKPQPEPVNA
jgi:hypothetical protein